MTLFSFLAAQTSYCGFFVVRELSPFGDFHGRSIEDRLASTNHFVKLGMLSES